MTIKKSLITTDWRAKGLKANPGTSSFRICLLLLIMLMVPVAVVSATYSFDSISPSECSSAGLCAATITGTGFVSTGTTIVNFSTTSQTAADAVSATGVTVASSTSITLTVPAHAESTCTVFINNAGQTGSIGNFIYRGAAPTLTGIYAGLNEGNSSVLTNMVYANALGGTVVNLSGTNLASPYYVTFGGTQNATTDYVGFTANTGANTGYNLTMKAPAHAAGAVTVTVYSPNGSASRQNFTYASIPVITGVSPAYGSSFGSDTVTITGTGGFNGATKVFFNNTQVVPTSSNATAIIVSTPANIQGATYVNITTPGGVSANAAGLFTYYDPPSIFNTTADSYAVSPLNGTYIGGTSVTILGKNLTAASAVTFNGTAATSYTINSAGTSITAVAPAYATNVTPYMVWATGSVLNIPVNVTTNGGTTKNLAGNFSYNIYKPNITAISPTTGSTGGNTTVTITGKNLSYASKVYFGNNPNTTAGITLNSDTSLTVVAPSSTVANYVTVNVTTPGGVSVDPIQYYYTQSAPTFTSVSPTFGSDGGNQWVNITGTGFIAASAVSFGGSTATFAVINDTSITAKTPALQAQTVNIVITVPGNTAVGQNAYTFQGAPHITAISPSYGGTLGGNTVTITGTNLTGASYVRFNVTPNTGSITVNSAGTSLTAIVPPANGTWALPANVNVSTYITDNMVTRTYSSTTENVAYQYNAAGTFTRISPTNGPISGGTLVSFNGTGLNNATQVTFDGIPATNMLTDLNAGTWITANAPAHAAGTVAILIQTPAGIVSNSSNKFTYLGNPSNILVTPAAGPTTGGTPVTITGLSFTGATAATFGTTPANNFVLVNDTMITATTPTGTAGTVSVVISATGGTGTGTFTYQAAPTVTGVSPSTGSVLGGTSVTITGTNLLGATAVQFGSTAATSFNVVSGTSITATSPAATTAGIVNVTVTTASGTSAISSADEFTYTVTPLTTSTVGVFRNGAVYLAGSNTNGGAPVNAFSYGMTGDVPVVGQWTSTQTAKTIGIFRGSNGMFYLRNTNNNGVADTKFNFGQAGDVPVSGHWSGAGSDTVGVFRTGTFFLAGSNVNGGGTVNAFNYGMSTDVPVAGDWSGTGTTTVGIFRSGLWALASSNVAGGGTVQYITFGQAGDVPVTGDWNADGKTEVGVFRNGMIFQATPAGTLSGYFNYGMTNDLPVGGYFG